MVALDGENIENQGFHREYTEIPQARERVLLFGLGFSRFCDIFFILFFLAATRVGSDEGSRSQDMGFDVHRPARRTEGVLNYFEQGGLI
jgi:hypothetical protein